MGTTVAAKKERPVSLRFRSTDLGLIDRAASLRGRSRTEFMRDAAVREAEEILLYSAIIQQSPDAFAQFRVAIDAPARSVPALVKLFRAPVPWRQPGGRRDRKRR